MKRVQEWFQARDVREQKLLRYLVWLLPVLLFSLAVQVSNALLEAKQQKFKNLSDLRASLVEHQAELQELSSVPRSGGDLASQVDSALQIFKLQPDKTEERQAKKRTVIRLEFNEVAFANLVRFLHRVDIAYQAQVSSAIIQPIDNKIGLVKAQIELSV